MIRRGFLLVGARHRQDAAEADDRVQDEEAAIELGYGSYPKLRRYERERTRAEKELQDVRRVMKRRGVF